MRTCPLPAVALCPVDCLPRPTGTLPLFLPGLMLVSCRWPVLFGQPFRLASLPLAMGAVFCPPALAARYLRSARGLQLLEAHSRRALLKKHVLTQPQLRLSEPSSLGSSSLAIILPGAILRGVVFSLERHAHGLLRTRGLPETSHDCHRSWYPIPHAHHDWNWLKSLGLEEGLSGCQLRDGEKGQVAEGRFWGLGWLCFRLRAEHAIHLQVGSKSLG